MPTPRRLRLVTLNLWNLEGPWAARREVLLKELADLAPDVVALQEVAAPAGAVDQAEEIGARLGLEARAVTPGHLDDGTPIGNGLLTRWPIVREQHVLLPNPEGDLQRCLLMVEVTTPTGHRLPVFVTHLSWKPQHGQERLGQITRIVEVIDEWAPAAPDQAAPVLAGDFNAAPESDEIRFLTGLHAVDGRRVHFADAWQYAGDRTAGYTFTPDNGFRSGSCEPPRRVDYVFLRGPDYRLAGKPRAARLAFTRPVVVGGAPVWASDHYGLCVDVELPDLIAESAVP